MPSYDIVPANQPAVTGLPRSLTDLRLARQTSRALATLDQNLELRQAAVLAENVVAIAKVQGVVDTAREAATSYTMLRRWADALTGGDVILADELRVILDTARIGCAEIVSDLIAGYCREGRR